MMGHGGPCAGGVIEYDGSGGLASWHPGADPLD